ncbi:class I SAM-dependent methyltransferase [Thalassospira lucentensis]|uniref:class I SAM-dependent methyltransferase n=1 Tax=Thalassospira lucentensis TaxID=168935 RepID=UPI0003B52254|nr:class I SAM-dependent methyltransferase [Thalassospira lucentensis]RCK18818.1 hypothetical protein TH1_22170 [Thalassospira lucentensis MCCC 1A00383 = DSM 14000]
MIKLNHIDDGKSFDFGRISEDYAKFRDIYPPEFFSKIHQIGLCSEGNTVLDLGTGTGVLPRTLAKYGAKFIGADISEHQIARARQLSQGLNIEYVVSPAEEVDFPANTFDTVLACMCFTYFDKTKLMPRIHKMLKENGRFAIMSLVWLPKESEIAKRGEELVLEVNPDWNGVGYDRPKFTKEGIPESYKVDLSSGFTVDESCAFDVSIPFTREAWHGRMKATRGLAAASITEEQRAYFDKEHWKYLEQQPKIFEVLHSAVFCVLKKA